ncbi:RDD family protein [Parvularcula dongshanensis]|uniref:Putative RDD family membrane protein YckC n=1 Tax=Parvularcula dongshanensis TaxID=1173995 RepID=A0A840I3Z8_9PROT|nr:RDD family protein [Parvularcula dongshanensis]MBB4659001.1 putative RDD family membrane protein YckC [Parvularcula dongshanensis]
MSAGVKTRERSLITPEGVDLRLKLGEAGARAGAFLLDLTFMLIALIVVTVLLIVAFSQLGAAPGASGRADAFAVVWILFFFVLRSFYFTGFEIGPRAATPGKRLLGLRVAARDGGRLSPLGVLARNAMREVELFLPLSFLLSDAVGVDALISIVALVWCGIFVLFPLFNRDRLRAGDLIGGTWVIEAPRRKLLPDLSAAAASDAYAFTTAALDAYGIKELHVLEDVLRAKDDATLKAVAERIRAKIGRPAKPGEADAAFLEAYYQALRGRLEGRLLFGQRRADKHAR